MLFRSCGEKYIRTQEHKYYGECIQVMVYQHNYVSNTQLICLPTLNFDHWYVCYSEVCTFTLLCRCVS